MLRKTLAICSLMVCAASFSQTTSLAWSRLPDPAGAYQNADVRVASRGTMGVYAAINLQASGAPEGSTRAMAYTRAGTVAWRAASPLPGYTVEAISVPSGFVMALYSGTQVRLVKYSTMGTLEWNHALDLGFTPGLLDVDAHSGSVAVLVSSEDYSSSRLFTFSEAGQLRWRSGTLGTRYFLKAEGDFVYAGGFNGTDPTSRVAIDRFPVQGGAPLTFADTTAGYQLNDFTVDQGSVLFLGSPTAGTTGLRFGKLSPEMAFVHGSVFSDVRYPNLSAGHIRLNRQGRIFATAFSQTTSANQLVLLRGSFFDDRLTVASARPSSAVESFATSNLELDPEGGVFQSGLRDTNGTAVAVLRRFDYAGASLGERVIPSAYGLQQLVVDGMGEPYTGGSYLQPGGAAPMVTRSFTAPKALPKNYVLTQNGELNITLPATGLAGGQEGVISLLSSPARGTLSFQPNGTFRYVPGRNFVGTDQFDYQIERGGMTARGTARVTTECRVATLDVPERVAAGVPSVRGVIRLSGPAAPGDVTVTLNYSPEFGGPRSIVIPRGVQMGTFDFYPAMVDGLTFGKIQAVYGQNYVEEQVQVRPGQFSGFGVENEVFSGNLAHGSVHLDGLNNLPVEVRVTSSNPTVARPQGTGIVTIPARGTMESFALSTGSVSVDTPVTVTGTSGGVSRTATLRVCAQRMSDFTLETPSIQGGQSGSAFIKIFGNAGPSGLTISLRDNSSFASLPMTVTIPAGGQSVDVPISTSRVTSTIRVTLTAQLGSQVANRILEIRP